MIKSHVIVVIFEKLIGITSRIGITMEPEFMVIDACKAMQFYRYFKTQWIENIFSNWQIFQTPAGFTTTNNPVESYNAIIKRFFTNRLKLNLIPALEIFKNECIEPESSREFHYAKTKEVTACLENKAKKLDESKFIKIDKHLYQYNHKNGDISTINLTNENAHVMKQWTRDCVFI